MGLFCQHREGVAVSCHGRHLDVPSLPGWLPRPAVAPPKSPCRLNPTKHPIPLVIHPLWFPTPQGAQKNGPHKNSLGTCRKQEGEETDNQGAKMRALKVWATRKTGPQRDGTPEMWEAKRLGNQKREDDQDLGCQRGSKPRFVVSQGIWMPNWFG